MNVISSFGLPRSQAGVTITGFANCMLKWQFFTHFCGAEGTCSSPGPDWAHACSWQVKMSVHAQSNQTQTLVGNVSHTSCEPEACTHLMVVRAHTLIHTIMNESWKRTPIHRGPIASPAHTCAQIRTCLHRDEAHPTPVWQCRAGPRLALQHCVSQ